MICNTCHHSFTAGRPLAISLSLRKNAPCSCKCHEAAENIVAATLNDRPEMVDVFRRMLLRYKVDVSSQSHSGFDRPERREVGNA